MLVLFVFVLLLLLRYISFPTPCVVLVIIDIFIFETLHHFVSPGSLLGQVEVPTSPFYPLINLIISYEELRLSLKPKSDNLQRYSLHYYSTLTLQPFIIIAI